MVSVHMRRPQAPFKHSMLFCVQASLDSPSPASAAGSGSPTPAPGPSSFVCHSPAAIVFAAEAELTARHHVNVAITLVPSNAVPGRH